MDTEFLKSNRFWALVVMALVYVGFAYGVIPREFLDAAVIVLGGHIGLKTVDRVADKMAERGSN